MEKVNLGRTGLTVSRLAFGTGTGGWGGRSEQTVLGLDGLASLLRAAYDAGVNFWDTADEYGSHAHVARALRGIPRDHVVIATKTTARSAEAATRDVERFLRELNTDVLDIVLLHCMTERAWPQRYAGALEALARAKEQGKLRAAGISCHDLGALRIAAQTEWVDVVLVRINVAGKNMDAAPDRVVPVIEQMYRSGKGVYGMKALGCGQLAADPRAALRYVLQLGTVHAITVGTSTRDQLDQNRMLVAELAPQYPLRAVA
jgi:aryl-alcohol dehydrogenase-like predicted oxidoreductase